MWDYAAEPSQSEYYEQVLGRWRDLSDRMLGLPAQRPRQEVAAGWADPEFPIVRGRFVKYEPYTEWVGYGTVRRMTLTEIEAEEVDVSFGHPH